MALPLAARRHHGYPDTRAHWQMENRHMRMAILLAALALAACNDPAPAAKPEAKVAAAPQAAVPRLNAIDRSHAGTPAPTITFENVGRKPISLADYRGRKVLVNLWATWCAPCLAEMPQIDTLAATRGDALAVLPISQDMEGWQVVEPFFARKRFKALKPYLDQPGSFAESLKARGLPVSILYDEKGREIWRVAGTPDWAALAAQGVV